MNSVLLAKEGAIDWLAFGELRGYIQSCGCDPKTNLGGVKRIARLVQREKIFYPNVKVFDLGNNFAFPDSKSNKLKNKYIQLALSEIKPTAALYSVLELEKKNFSHSYPYVLSNLKALNPHVSEKLETEKFQVFGYVWDEKVRNQVEMWSEKFQKKMGKIFLEKKKILLFFGPQKHLDQIISSKIFDLIISGNSSPWSTATSFLEKEDPSRLVRSSKSMVVRMVPHAGLGVLRGGSLSKVKSKSLHDIVSSGNKTVNFYDKSETLKGGIFNQNNITWLSPEFDQNSPVEKVVNNYVEASINEFKVFEKEQSLLSHDSPYIGANACKNCHNIEFTKWKSSKHAKAYETLVKKGKSQLLECVGCHVAGFKKNGFISKGLTPELKGVQCENCHGPRKKHSKNPSLKFKNNVSPYKTCQTCHHTPHSSDFKIKEYWPQIKH